MLKLTGITKVYDVADERVEALKGVDLEFGDSEFVSILGPSGCGKTTLLNIIGGLDKYSSGNMEISGISTAEYTDRDWDSYRNHSIGFVFQNYNLIPHLTVLDNVELALTLVGEEKESRRRRALAALEMVGLRNKAFKKPNQLSGGQMQRVAIARALINDPEIILADEPTGALDSETSIQIMDILKKISMTRLVIMVTHNGELARDYSTRIIRLHDGKVVGDSNPYREEKNAGEVGAAGQIKQAVRYENGLLSDDGSPVTDGEAASAKRAYVQEIGKEKIVILTTGRGKVIAKLSSKLKKQIKCELAEKKVVFGKELEEVSAALGIKKTVNKAAEKYANCPAMSTATAFKLSLTNMISKKFRTFLTALAGSIGILGIALVLGLYSGLNGFIVRQEVALASYPITITRSANDYESMVQTVVSSLDGLDGKYDRDKVYVYKLVQQILKNQTNVNEIDAEMVEQLKQIDPKLYYDVFMNYGINFNAVKYIAKDTKIFGEISLSSAYYMAIDTNAYWTQMPARELVEEQYELISGRYPSSSTDVVLILDSRNQISDINLFYNGLDLESVSLNYKESNDVGDLSFEFEKFVGQKFRLVRNDSYYVKHSADSYGGKNETTTPYGAISLINSEIASRVGSGYQMRIYRGTTKTDTEGYKYDGIEYDEIVVSGIIKLKDDVSVGVLGGKAIGYLPSLTEKVIKDSYSSKVTQNALNSYINNYKSSHGGAEPSDWELTSSMRGYGYATIPTSISIYCKGYEAKVGVKAAIAEISEQRKAEGKSEIVCSDIMSIVLNIVQQFIDIITCALIALTATSLVVSALMIGIITYVSVLERTREIGVLRALGARKIDVSRIFNAETAVIGFISGVLGIVITYLVSWPLGSYIASVTGISGLVALPWYFALLLVAVSVIITYVAGLIPAGIAKRKDPVKALRAE
ncbi:MAG: ABC transporter ATP-binding protein/permease [Clostridia bacterium]|nr:ABC transporter ATP-binding protein/permease [Clostridia bacterium]